MTKTEAKIVELLSVSIDGQADRVDEIVRSMPRQELNTLSIAQLQTHILELRSIATQLGRVATE